MKVVGAVLEIAVLSRCRIKPRRLERVSILTLIGASERLVPARFLFACPDSGGLVAQLAHQNLGGF
jgi:hypothetical protein